MKLSEFEEASKGRINVNRLTPLLDKLSKQERQAINDCLFFDNAPPSRFEDESEQKYNERMYNDYLSNTEFEEPTEDYHDKYNTKN